MTAWVSLECSGINTGHTVEASAYVGLSQCREKGSEEI